MYQYTTIIELGTRNRQRTFVLEGGDTYFEINIEEEKSSGADKWRSGLGDYFQRPDAGNREFESPSPTTNLRIFLAFFINNNSGKRILLSTRNST